MSENLELFDANDVDMSSLLTTLDGIGHEELKNRWPKLLAEMIDVVRACLKRDMPNINDKELQKYSDHLVAAIALYFGGRAIYLPMNKSLTTALRDNSMWNAFNGRNVPELAKSAKVSELYVYQVIKKQRALHMNKIQPRLDLGDHS